MIRVGSLFAGIGGFDLGFQRVGMETLWQVENDKWCNQVLRRHWRNVMRYQDIEEFDPNEAEEVDLICGGFPCQDLSTAGRREGLSGERSGLWWEFHRVLQEARPSWVVIENVTGLLSSNDGRDMGTVVGALGDIGYRWTYRVLDSQYYGVAQRRRRVFIVGHLGDGRAAEVLFEREGCQWDTPTCEEAGEGVAGDAARGFDQYSGEALGFSNVSDGSAARNADDKVPPHSRSITSGGGKPGQGYPAVMVSPTLHFHNTNDHWDVHRQAYVPSDVGVRRLTPLECERLQGFPDGWTACGIDEDEQAVEISDTQRYKQLGNAVTVNVAQWIGQRILQAS